MSLMFDFVDDRPTVVNNLVKLEMIILEIIPFTHFYCSINIGVRTIDRTPYHNIVAILREVRQQFGVDTRGLTEAQGRLFLSHWFLLLRDFDVSEMTVYIKSLTGEKDGDNKGKVHGESAFSQLQDKAV